MANTRMVVKLAERKTEMIGFNGSYNLIDIHNRRYLYDSAKSFGRIKHFFLLDSATGRIIHLFFCWIRPPVESLKQVDHSIKSIKLGISN